MTLTTHLHRVTLRLHFTVIEVRRYLTPQGRDVLGEYLGSLKDAATRARIEVRLAKLTIGLFGNSKSLGSGLHELRVDYGPGYRVYYANIGLRVILLLLAGDKNNQSADIARARGYLSEYKENANEDESGKDQKPQEGKHLAQRRIKKGTAR